MKTKFNVFVLIIATVAIGGFTWWANANGYLSSLADMGGGKAVQGTVTYNSIAKSGVGIQAFLIDPERKLLGSATTGPTGWYNIDNLPASVISLEAYKLEGCDNYKAKVSVDLTTVDINFLRKDIKLTKTVPNSGGYKGKVTDTKGAIVSGASIEVSMNQDNNFNRITTTNTAGEYYTTCMFQIGDNIDLRAVSSTGKSKVYSDVVDQGWNNLDMVIDISNTPKP